MSLPRSSNVASTATQPVVPSASRAPPPSPPPSAGPVHPLPPAAHVTRSCWPLNKALRGHVAAPLESVGPTSAWTLR